MKVQEKRIGKKIISSLLILLILLTQTAFFPSNYSVAAVNGIQITTSKTTNLVANEIVYVTISATTANGRGIKSLDGVICYDSTVFYELDNDFVEANATVAGGWQIGDVEEYGDYYDNGQVVSFLKTSSGDGTEGQIVVFPLKVKKNVATATVSFEDINAALTPSGNYENESGVSVTLGNSNPTPTTYTITYNKNTTDSVSNLPSNGTKTQGVAYTIPSTTPTRTNYTFTGYNTAANGSGTSYSAGGSYTTDANVTLYAQWQDARKTVTIKPNGTWNGSTSNVTRQGLPSSTTSLTGTPTTSTPGYTVSFNGNSHGTPSPLSKNQTKSFDKWVVTSGGGSISGTTYTFGNTDGVVEATYKNDAVSLSSVSVTANTGYTFTGWNTKADGSGTSYSSSASFTPTANITLYAQYSTVSSTLTVNPNGGTWEGSTSSQTFTQNYNTTKTISNPTRAAYTVTFNPNDGSVSPTSATQTVTFASWSKSGGGSISGTTYTFGATNGTLTAQYNIGSITFPTPTREGFRFDGWYTAAAGGTLRGNGGATYTPTSNETVYAHWTEIKSTLSVRPNGGTWEGSTANQTFTERAGTTKTISNPTRAAYTATFNANGGTVSPTSATQTVSFDGWTKTGGGTLSGTTFTFSDTDATLEAKFTIGTISLPTPERNGFTFNGWYTAATGGTRRGGAGDAYTPTANETLYAQWTEIKSTLTIKPGTDAKWNNISGDQTFEEAAGYSMSLPAPVHNKRTITLNANGGSVSPTSLQQDVDFTHWTRSNNSTYTGGTTYTFGTSNETLTAHYEDKSVTLPEPTKAGATFNGWYTSATGGTRRGGAGDSYTPTTSETLYAQWTEATYTLTVDANGGTWSGSTITGSLNQQKTVANPTAPTGYKVTLNANGGSVSPTSINQTVSFTGWTVTAGPGTVSGSTYTFGAGDGAIRANYERQDVTIPTPTRTGYTFDGWNTQQDGSGNSVSVGTYTPTANITLYAQWTPKELTITFNPNGGTVNPTSKPVTYDAQYGTLPTPTRAGYDFDGWYLGTTKITETSIVKITTDSTLVAKWLGAEFTVYFDYNGGSGSTSSKTVRNEGTYGTLPTPNNWTGHTFVGWFTDAENGTEITSGTTVNLTENQTLYAHWNVVKSTLAVNPDGGTWRYSTNVTYIGPKNMGYREPIEDPTHDTRTITFNANGGTTSATSATQTVTFNKWTLSNGSDFTGTHYTFTENDETLTANYTNGSITLPTANKINATFKGWYTSTGELAGMGGATYTPIKAETLTARWEEVASELVVDPNGGTWRGSNQVQTIEGTAGSSETIQNPTGGTGYTVTLYNNDGTNANQQLVQQKAFTNWTKTGAGTFNASTSTYTFGDAEGRLTANYESQPVQIPATLTRTGYTFQGWNTEQNGTGDTVPAGQYTPTKNTDLYAQWRVAVYTLYFDAGTEGTVNPTSKEVTYGEAYGIFPTPTTHGHRFIGWFDSNGREVKETDLYTITGDSTLYARYELQKYLVRFLNDDGSIITSSEVEYGTRVTYEGDLPEATNIPAGYKARFSYWDDEDDLDCITGDVDVVAKYTFIPIKYIIDYRNTRGFNNSMNPLRYTVTDSGKPIQDLAGDSENIFEGWYVIENNQFKKVTSVDTSKLENVLVYAHWQGDKLYLNSRKYKIGENDIDIYEKNDVYLDKIEPNTTVKQLRENCGTNGLIVVKNGDEVIDENAFVGTGMKIYDTGYGEEFVLTAVVMGDVTGDGKVTISDVTNLNKVVQKLTTLKDAYFKAGDVNDSNSITISDLTAVNKVVQKISKFTYKKPNQ